MLAGFETSWTVSEICLLLLLRPWSNEQIPSKCYNRGRQGKMSNSISQLTFPPVLKCDVQDFTVLSWSWLIHRINRIFPRKAAECHNYTNVYFYAVKPVIMWLIIFLREDSTTLKKLSGLYRIINMFCLCSF